MFGQQPYYYQVPQQRSLQQYDYGPQLKGRFVSSIDEVRASQIDFDGSVFVFPDVANKRIYTKQIALDGSATLNVYALTETPNFNQASGDFVTRDEFAAVIGEIKSLIGGGNYGRSKNTVVPADDEFPSF